jgi:hypothetical protein
MKLNGKMMVAVVMMVGSLAAAGCNTASASDAGPVAPEETAATAPVENNGTSSAANGVEKDAFGFHYYAPFAPPAARFEFRGVAPSARHFWAPGYYRWNGREHTWIGGRWELRRDGFEFIAPHWVNRFGRSEYIPGRWVRRF